MNRLKKNASTEEINEYLNLLKEDCIGEQEAIDQYVNHIANIEIQEINETLTHIMNEEKEHLKELQELIQKYKRN